MPGAIEIPVRLGFFLGVLLMNGALGSIRPALPSWKRRRCLITINDKAFSCLL